MKNFSKHYQKRIAELKAENASLKADLERLTKAGDAMRESIICGTSSDDIQAVLGWDAAKEGKGQP
jgi:hypothetical protein